MIQPTKLPIISGGDSERILRAFLKDKIRDLKRQLDPIFKNRLVNWRKAYEAQPAQAERNFPFENASNIVVPVIGIHADSLLARVMAANLKTNPLWVVKVLGEVGDSQFGDSRSILEEFLGYVGLEPTELDLYPVYHEYYGETIRYGTSVIKCPQIDLREDVVAGGAGNNIGFEERVIYNGPKPMKLPFHDFLIDESDKFVEASPFVAHIVHLKREALEERAHKGIYDKAAVAKVLTMPDRQSPGHIESQRMSDAGAAPTGGEGFEEWDIYECHFKYRWNSHYTRVIVWYHDNSDTIVRAFFNYYPSCIFIASRLFYRDDCFHGYGFAEILGPFQEEISVIHNQRRDNRSVSNTVCFRVDPDSKIWKGYKIYPSAMLPGMKDEIEALPMGQAMDMSIDEERLSLDLAERRSGVSPPQQGMGAGFNTKRGVYTAMGTLSLMQDGSTRTDLNITDMRYAHTRLGRLLCDMYAEFGIGDRDLYFGRKGRLLAEALELYKNKALALPITAATASINREVEKQNDTLLSNIARQHYGLIVQMYQGMANPGTPPEAKRYIGEAMQAANLLMRTIFRHFMMDEVDRLAPDVPKAPPEQPPGGPGGLPPGGPGASGQPAPPPGQPGQQPRLPIPGLTGGGVVQ